MISLDTKVGGALTKNMHMILADNATDYAEFKRFSGLPNQLPHPFRHIPFQYLVKAFRYPNKVVFNLIDRMTAISVLHPASSLANIIAAKANRLKLMVLTL